MPLRIRPILRAALAAPLAAAAAGCLSSTTDVTGTTPTPSYAYVRVVQGVSDATNGVDFSVNGAAQLTGVPLGAFFPTQAGRYGALNPGATLGFAATGSGAPFYSQAPAALTTNNYFTLVSYGRVSGGTGPAATAALISDTTPVTSGVVLLRAFNAVDYVTAGSGTQVDVYAYPRGTTRPTTPTMAGVAYGASSGYVTSTAGTLTVDVFAAGAASTGTPLFTTTLATAANVVRTLVLLDPATGSTTGSVLALADQN